MRNRKLIVALSVAVLCTVLTGIICFSGILDGKDSAAEAASIKQGSKGAQVRTIQTKLKNWGYYTGSVDGIYGARTAEAVKKFQRRNGLTADGIVGPATAAALGITLSATTVSTGSTSTSNDTYLLARCVYAEARGEPYTGMVAVAAVVLNRVRHPDFPNTIAGVIYQPWAFTCVNDGQINLSPNNTAMQAARDALNGWDPTNGCIYYYNPSTTTNAWIWSRPILLVIGKHNFAK